MNTNMIEFRWFSKIFALKVSLQLLTLELTETLLIFQCFSDILSSLLKRPLYAESGIIGARLPHQSTEVRYVINLFMPAVS